jgi:hypothetical protein
MLHTYTVRKTVGCRGLVDVDVVFSNGDVETLNAVTAVYHRVDGTVTVQTNPGQVKYWDREKNVRRGIRRILEVRTAARVLYDFHTQRDLAEASRLALEILADSAAHRGNPA